MTDFRREIPLRAILNAKIIDYAITTESFGGCIQRTLSLVGYPPSLEYQFKNPAFICGLLYCLIVVPKGAFPLEQNHAIYKQFESLRLLDLFDVRRKHKDFDMALPGNA